MISLRDLSHEQKIFLVTRVHTFFDDRYFIPEYITKKVTLDEVNDLTMFSIMCTIRDNEQMELMGIEDEYKEQFRKAFLDNGIDIYDRFDDQAYNLFCTFSDPEWEPMFDDEEAEDDIDTCLTEDALRMTFEDAGQMKINSAEERIERAKIYYKFLKYGK